MSNNMYEKSLVQIQMQKTLSHTFMVIRFDTMKGINPSINRYHLLDLLHEYADKWIFKRLKPKLMQTNVLVILKAHNYTLYGNVFWGTNIVWQRSSCLKSS